MERFILNIKKGKAAVQRSVSNYARMGIDIEVLEINDCEFKVKIAQNRLLNGFIMNQKQLIERAKEIFQPTGLNIKVIPMVYQLNVVHISALWINQKMEEFDIRRNDIIKQLAIDKSSLCLYLSGERKMNKLVKSAFYFYFLKNDFFCFTVSFRFAHK